MNTNALNKHSEQAGSLFSVRAFTSHSVTEVVYHHRLVTCFNEFHHTVAPDVASSTCDQHLLCHSQKPGRYNTDTHRLNTPFSVPMELFNPSWQAVDPDCDRGSVTTDPRSRRALEKQDILQSKLH